MLQTQTDKPDSQQNNPVAAPVVASEPTQAEIGHVAEVSNADPASNEAPLSTASKEPPQDADGDYASKWAYMDQAVLVRRTKAYCIAITSKGKLDWGTTDAFDDDVKALSNEAKRSHAALLADIAFAEASLCEELPETVKIHYKVLLGEAMVLAFSDEYDSATRMLESARIYIQARNEETSRKWYLAATGSASLLAVAGALLTWFFRSQVSATLGSTGFWLLLLGLSGSLGTMLSVIQRSGTLQFDACAGKTLHWYEGISRVAAGSISAVIVALAMRSDFVLGVFAASGHMNKMCLLAAIVAGTGERLAGSIISKFDATENRSGEGASI